MEENKLCVIDAENLLDLEFAPMKFCIRSLLPQGLCILGGAPKIGKSWLVLDWCVRIAKGEPIWGMETTGGTTLYLCLEDTLQRVQRRLSSIDEEGSERLFFATVAGTLADDLEAQLLSFLREHPDTVLIVVDTFQMVRGNGSEPTYSSDYQDIQKLKRIADSQRVTILLVHHLRKQYDRDPVNKLSGTTGISGAVDAVYVLDKKERAQNAALLICTGRDVEYRELELRFSKERWVWELVSDSAQSPEQVMPPELQAFLAYMKEIKYFSGRNCDMTDAFNRFSGCSIEPRRLKQMMNGWRETLEKEGLTFRSYRSNGLRLVEVQFTQAVPQVP